MTLCMALPAHRVTSSTTNLLVFLSLTVAGLLFVNVFLKRRKVIEKSLTSSQYKVNGPGSNSLAGVGMSVEFVYFLKILFFFWLTIDINYMIILREITDAGTIFRFMLRNVGWDDLEQEVAHLLITLAFNSLKNCPKST